METMNYRHAAHAGFTVAFDLDAGIGVAHDAFGEPCGTIERQASALGVGYWAFVAGRQLPGECVSVSQALRKIAIYHGA